MVPRLKSTIIDIVVVSPYTKVYRLYFPETGTKLYKGVVSHRHLARTWLERCYVKALPGTKPRIEKDVAFLTYLSAHSIV